MALDLTKSARAGDGGVLFQSNGGIDAVLTLIAQNVLGQTWGGNAQTFRVYGTDALYASLGHSGSAGFLRTSTAVDLGLGVNGADKWKVGGTTGHLLASTDNANDIGATGATRPRSVYVSNSVNVETVNGAQWKSGSISEEITLSTSGTTTDSTADLLPANSIIEAVVARITDAITTATDWKLGDASTAARFTAANSTRAAGTTDIGIVVANPANANAAGPVQAAAAKLRITTTGTPGAGKVRVTVFYRQFTAPTS